MRPYLVCLCAVLWSLQDASEHLFQNHNLLHLYLCKIPKWVAAGAVLSTDCKTHLERRWIAMCASPLGSDNSTAIAAIGFDVGFLLICHSLKLRASHVDWSCPWMEALLHRALHQHETQGNIKKCLEDDGTEVPLSKVAFALRRLLSKPSKACTCQIQV